MAAFANATPEAFADGSRARRNCGFLFLDAAPRREIHRKTSEPMSAFVVRACDCCESGALMLISRRVQRVPAQIVLRKRRGDSLEHPRAAQVQAIEMRELRIARIGRD